jgi:maleamate amidohydrolase
MVPYSPYKEKDWVHVLPLEDREVYEKSGFNQSLSMGSNPALLVIDSTYGFTGSKPQCIEEAIAEYPTACGGDAWLALPKIKQLLSLFRQHHLPIVYTVMDLKSRPFIGRATSASKPIAEGFNQFPDMILPQENEWILEKTKASAFFGTPLNAYMLKLKIDTWVICGGSTSGCVRASAVDAFSYGLSCFVVEDACFDRVRMVHNYNLFDLNAKYAAVRTVEEMQNLFMQRHAQAHL